MKEVKTKIKIKIKIVLWECRVWSYKNLSIILYFFIIQFVEIFLIQQNIKWFVFWAI